MTQIDQVMKLTNESTLLNYYSMSYEVLLTKIFDACSQQRQKETEDPTRVMQTCNILDLKDVKLRKAPEAYKFIKPASEMAQNYYPEILGKYFKHYLVCLSSMLRCCLQVSGPSLKCG